MIIDLLNTTKAILPEFSGYKVAYFRVEGWGDGSGNSNIVPTQDPIIEMCLVPCDMTVDYKEKGSLSMYTIPSGSITIRFKAGHPWPYIGRYVPPNKELEFDDGLAITYKEE